MSRSALQADDTIVAIASPTAPAARGIVRMSGPHVLSVLATMGADVGVGRLARRCSVTVDAGRPLGKVPANVLVWPTGRSYTGQPSAEIHTFGSLPVLSAIVDAACDAGARAARPGEFTMRAFLAGRLDLTQAEAVLGVIDAEHRGSLDHALKQLAGNLSRPLETMRKLTLDLLADVEAGLDFVDEDIEFIRDDQLEQRLSEMQRTLRQTQQMVGSRGGGAARPVIALRGEPNAGKSCLLNRLAGTDAAIVADIAGTTRDSVTADAEIEGIAVTLVDTAGLETADTEISRLSQDQADRASEGANVRLWCVDVTRADFTAAAERLRLASADPVGATIDLWIATKSDQTSAVQIDSTWLLCSAITSDGIDELKSRIASAISSRDAEETGGVMGTAARCGQSLRRAGEAMEAALRITWQGEGHEFVAAELRLLADCLGEVTGAVYTDDILDRVFSRFCIGK